MLIVDVLNIIGEFSGYEQNHPEGLSEVRLRFTEELDVVYEEKMTLWGELYVCYPQKNPKEYGVFGWCYLETITQDRAWWGERILTFEEVNEEYDPHYYYYGQTWTNMYLCSQQHFDDI
jgi:hypothetical protein